MVVALDGVPGMENRIALMPPPVMAAQYTHTSRAIAGSGSAPFPCGACRQSLYEFAPVLDVLVTWDGNVRKTTLAALLPEGFGPSSLGKEG